MNILLTGATGYLGSHLSMALVAAGNKVVALKRRDSDLGLLGDIRSELVWYDLEQGGMSAALNDVRFDVVVHTATCYGRAGESTGEMFFANTVWPLQLLEAVVSARIPLFINTDTSLDLSLNAYALSKKQFRDWGCYVADQKNICFLNILLEHFYGPGDMETKFVTQVIRSCLRGEPELLLTAGTQLRDFIFIDDVVAAYLMLIRHAAAVAPKFIEYGLGSGVAVPVREVVTMIKGLTCSATRLNFGAVPLRKNESMVSLGDTGALQSLGWHSRFSLADGLAYTIDRERELMKRTTI